MSSTEQPLERSDMGFAKPWRKGPRASAPAILCTNLYPMFPAPRSGKIRVLACPFTGELAAFLHNGRNNGAIQLDFSVKDKVGFSFL